MLVSERFPVYDSIFPVHRAAIGNGGMAMARHVTYIPDCPDCGAEMVQRARYVDGSRTDGDPFGMMLRWWQCPDCGRRSCEAESFDEFAALTAELTGKIVE